MRLHCLRTLLGFPGYRVATLAIEPRRGRTSVILGLERLKRLHACGPCGRPIRTPHSSWWIEVQHLSLWEYPTFLRVRRFRVHCPECGLNLEPLPFAADGPLVTHGLAALVYELCKVMTVQAAGALLLLHRATVKTIDKRALETVQAERSLEGITVLGVDEIAVGRGQTYWTMLSALEGPRGPERLNVVPGRKEKDLRTFWRWFGAPRAQRVTHAVMDRWKPYRNRFKAHCGPGLAIIDDTFHVIRHLLDALNSVRKAELRKAAGRFKGLLARSSSCWPGKLTSAARRGKRSTTCWGPAASGSRPICSRSRSPICGPTSPRPAPGASSTDGSTNSSGVGSSPTTSSPAWWRLTSTASWPAATSGCRWGTSRPPISRPRISSAAPTATGTRSTCG